MYFAERNDCLVFTSEKWPLEQIKYQDISNIRGEILEAPVWKGEITETENSLKIRELFLDL